MAAINDESKNRYFHVLADGKFHETVDELTEGATKRDYETSDGKTGTKYELLYTEVSGLITKVDFHEGDYGKNLLLTIVDGEDEPIVLSLNTAQNYGEDMMKKLLAIDMSLPVKIRPYSFPDEKTGKQRKGMSITQNGQKVQNYFYDPVAKENIHGYPKPKFKKGKTTLSTNEWKLYFMEARIFLIDTITEKFEIEDKEQISTVPRQEGESDEDYEERKKAIAKFD